MSKYRADVPTVLGNPAKVIAQPRTRAYIYGVSIPLIALLVGLGYLTDGTAGLVLNLVAAVLGVGTSTLAAVNTPAPKPRDPNARA
jgi:hypothetical protein